jgi:hypothetical protein
MKAVLEARKEEENKLFKPHISSNSTRLISRLKNSELPLKARS